MLHQLAETEVERVGTIADWALVLYEDMRLAGVVADAAMTSRDPTFPFGSAWKGR